MLVFQSLDLAARLRHRLVALVAHLSQQRRHLGHAFAILGVEGEVAHTHESVQEQVDFCKKFQAPEGGTSWTSWTHERKLI